MENPKIIREITVKISYNMKDVEVEELKLKREDDKIYLNNSLLNRKKRNELTREEEDHLRECYEDEDGNVNEFGFFVMTLIWAIDITIPEMNDNFDPIHQDIIAYIFKRLLDDKSKIPNNSVFEYSPGRLRCNKKKVSLPTTGSGYAEWDIEELNKFFDNLDDKL